MSTKKRAAKPRGQKQTTAKAAKLVPSQPILKEAFEKYGSWSLVANALGYSAPGSLYGWIKEPETFLPKHEQRIRDLLDGKPLAPLNGSKVRLGKHDKGELGIAIVYSQTGVDPTRILDVAEPMGGADIFRKHHADGSWIQIFRFADLGDLMLFRQWVANKGYDVVTP